VDDKAIENLIKKYRETLQIDESSALGVFAITDIKTETTLLLPKFYELNEYEQMAILFHEAYWLMFPKSSYQKTINAEVTAQEYFETKDSLSGLEFLKAIDAFEESLFYSVEMDLANNSLGDLISERTILAKDLLGIDFLTCLIRNELNSCRPFLTDHSYTYGLNYPDSLLLYAITEFSIDFFGKDRNSNNIINPDVRYYEREIARHDEDQLEKATVLLDRSNPNSLVLDIAVEVQIENESDDAGAKSVVRNLLRLRLK